MQTPFQQLDQSLIQYLYEYWFGWIDSSALRKDETLFFGDYPGKMAFFLAVQVRNERVKGTN